MHATEARVDDECGSWADGGRGEKTSVGIGDMLAKTIAGWMTHWQGIGFCQPAGTIAQAVGRVRMRLDWMAVFSDCWLWVEGVVCPDWLVMSLMVPWPSSANCCRWMTRQHWVRRREARSCLNLDLSARYFPSQV